MAGYLKLEDHEVIEFGGVADVLEAMRHRAPDLAILDVAMPTMGAVEPSPLLKEYRPNTKVLLFSGYEMDTSVKDLLAAGADSFLRKPVRSEVLLTEIGRILGDIRMTTRIPAESSRESEFRSIADAETGTAKKKRVPALFGDSSSRPS
mgnify:CR=1 FL=1